jgi:hypothetical protein
LPIKQQSPASYWLGFIYPVVIPTGIAYPKLKASDSDRAYYAQQAGSVPRKLRTADEDDKQTIFKLIDKMLTNKKFKDFFQKNVAAL